MNRFSDKEKQLFWDLKFYAVLSTIFSQLTLLLNCYSAMVYFWRHVISLVPQWKTHPNPVMTQYIRERSGDIGDYITSLVREWKVYYSLAFWHRWRWCQGPCPILQLGYGGFLERSLMCWTITGLRCVFHCGTSEFTWR